MPINYAFGGAFTVTTIYILFTFPFVVYNRRKENLRLEKVAKSEVKWVRNENGIKKIGSIIFFKNEHFEITKTKKIGLKILYPKPMFIYAEEIENFYNY